MMTVPEPKVTSILNPSLSLDPNKISIPELDRCNPMIIPKIRVRLLTMICQRSISRTVHEVTIGTIFRQATIVLVTCLAEFVRVRPHT